MTQFKYTWLASSGHDPANSSDSEKMAQMKCLVSLSLVLSLLLPFQCFLTSALDQTVSDLPDEVLVHKSLKQQRGKQLGIGKHDSIGIRKLGVVIKARRGQRFIPSGGRASSTRSSAATGKELSLSKLPVLLLLPFS